MKAEKQGYFTLEEWRRGLKALRVDTLDNVKESKMASNFTAMSSVGSFVAHNGLVMNKKLSSSSNRLSSLASIY
ncbi:hypothetical protein J1N35_014304 [Gossypium stocksii]|uniref:Uncharacterized protein n=1 Tax=Gossypium stocksii TaxID=47602 RepID=A0A9D4A7G9_9ROSI|nr:hypothetical protein J1N35_014304 [Gossypium stocksii]